MRNPRPTSDDIPLSGCRSGNLSLNKFTAVVVTALLAVPSPLSASITWGAAITLAIAPATLTTLWRDVRGRWLMISIIGLVPSGWVVAQISMPQDPGRSFNSNFFLYEAALPVGLVASVAGAYWSILQLGLRRFMLIFFTTLLAVSPFLYPKLADNPWKYGLALPASMLVILLFAKHRLLLGFIIAPLLAALSIAADFRAWVALLAVATVLTLFTRGQRTRPSASRVASLGLLTMAVTTTIGWLTAQAATAGMLGSYLERRTRIQLETSSGNLLLGGRPEWGAAIALWRETPLGLGIGVAPSRADYWLAIRSMPLSSLAQQELSGVAKSFAQGLVSFHSTFLTFWGVYGPVGVLVATLALVYGIRAMLTTATSTIDVSLRGSVVLLMLSSVWDILFSATLIPQLSAGLAAAIYLLSGPHTALDRAKDSTHATKPSHQHHHNYAKRPDGAGIHGRYGRTPDVQ